MHPVADAGIFFIQNPVLAAITGLFPTRKVRMDIHHPNRPVGLEASQDFTIPVQPDRRRLVTEETSRMTFPHIFVHTGRRHDQDQGSNRLQNEIHQAPDIVFKLVEADGLLRIESVIRSDGNDSQVRQRAREIRSRSGQQIQGIVARSSGVDDSIKKAHRTKKRLRLRSTFQQAVDTSLPIQVV